MRNIIKVNNIQDAKDNPIRPIVALDNNGNLFAEGQSAGPEIEMVDFGLPSGTLWATNNIGAIPGSTPESYYGSYFAWGEIETKSDYSWETYKFGTSSSLTKYTSSDGKIVLEAEDDVATQTYGTEYHMPTVTEIQELIDETDNEWVTDYNGISGLKGCKFMKKSDHSVFIFIPAVGNYGLVWSSSRSSYISSDANYIYFNNNSVFTGADSRCYGCLVRAIKRS